MLATLTYEPGAEAPFTQWLAWGRRLGWLECGEDEYRLTRRGSFWAHWLQNHYSLDRLASLWAAGRERPWPEGVVL